MPTLDSTAKAALTGNFSPAWFVWLDVVSDPVRVANFGQDVTFASTGDSDLDGNTFVSFAGEFLDIGDVTNSESGSDTLTLTLSGIVTLDTALLNAIGNTANWQGRTCRVWFRLYDEGGVNAQGGVVAHYTGYMSSVSIMPGQKSQTIQVTIENYLVAFTAPSNRSYLNQKDYDAADNSAAATISAANGSVRGGVGVNQPGVAAGGAGTGAAGTGGAGDSGGSANGGGITGGGIGGAYGSIGEAGTYHGYYHSD